MAKKIALVRACYNPFGGAERFIMRALQALDKNTDIELTILTRRWETEDQLAATVDHIILNPFYLGKIGRDVSFARKVRAHIKKYPYDLVQSHERISGLDLYRAGDGVHHEWLKQRLINANFWQRLKICANPYHIYVKKQEIEMFTHPGLRAVICNSMMIKNEIQVWFKLPESKLHVIYNGVDTSTYHPRIKQDQPWRRGQWQIPIDAFCFLFVGSGYQRKGLAACIQALEQVPQAWLIVVGRDKQQKKYEQLAVDLNIASRVIFAGAQKDVLPFYAMADAFVLPTLYDPFPNAALEAMACGLPVITSNKSGIAELITSGEQGSVVEVGNIAQLTHAMAALMFSNQAESMGKKARLLANKYDLNTLAQQLSVLYDRLLTNKEAA